jgi:hypothetical protein
VTSVWTTSDEPDSAMRARIRQHPAGPRFGGLRRGAQTAKITTDPADGGVRMAETEEHHAEQIDEAQTEMSATADEMSEHGERVDRSIDEAKSTRQKALDDDAVPTASSDWEDDEPGDDGESSGDAGFDDPEDLDEDDDDLEDDDGYADDEDE